MHIQSNRHANYTITNSNKFIYNIPNKLSHSKPTKTLAPQTKNGKDRGWVMILHWKGCEEENLPFLSSSPWLCLVELNIFPSPNYKQFNRKQPYKHHQSNHSIPSISPIHHNPRFVNQITNSSQTHIKNQPNLMKSMTSWCPGRVREPG